MFYDQHGAGAEEKTPVINRLGEIPLFTGLAPGVLDKISREARYVRYEKDAAVLKQGSIRSRSSCDCICALKRERLQGRQIVLCYVLAGEILGSRTGVSHAVMSKDRLGR